MAIIHSLSPGFENQVSGVGCQVSGERSVGAETRNLVRNIYLHTVGLRYHNGPADNLGQRQNGESLFL